MSQSIALVEFTVTNNNNHMYLMLSQPDNKNFRHLNPKYDYGMISMVICSKNYDKFVGDAYTCSRDCYIEANLGPGTYVALIETSQ